MVKTLRAALLLITLVFAVAIYATPRHALAACSFTVTNTNDSGGGSLRQAINSANVASNIDTICFGIAGGVYQTINLLSTLQITQPVIIDGTTQGTTTVPTVELNGANAGVASGLWITSGGSTITGLIINRFAGDGIILTNNGGNTIQGNYIGTNSVGTAALGNGSSGIGMQSGNNIIGGSIAGQGNVVSGNAGTGIAITGSSASSNTIAGNRVGTDKNGAYAIKNGADGILVTNAPNNTIGGTTGVTPNGPCTGACNLTSGNGANGIGIWQSLAIGNTVVGNYAGVDVNGTSPLANGDIGLEVQDASNNIIGGTSPEERNIFSGNLGAGVSLTGTGAFGNVVKGNYIGPNVGGQVGMGNHKMGINIGSPTSGGTNNAHDNIIGGTTGVSPGGSCTGACNVISSNAWNGIYISGTTGGSNQILGNYVGISASGGLAMGNVLDGIGIVESSYNTIGGSAAGSRNIISGNGGSGVIVTGNSAGSNRIEGNYIGEATNQGIIGNQVNGITVAGGIQTAILANNISGNRYLGIDLGGYGVTVNDPGDPDGGPNGGQNKPTISFAIPYAGGENIVGDLNSLGSTSFRIDFFQSPSCDATGLGEGHDYIGNTVITTNTLGNASFNVLMPVVPKGYAVTTTANRMVGSTPVEGSEFSACVSAARNHPDGALVKPAGSNNIFMVENGGLRPIGSVEVLQSYKITNSEFKTATFADVYLPSLPGLYFKEGTLIRGSGPDVFVIDQISQYDYLKRKITSIDAFVSLGYTASDIITVPDSALGLGEGTPLGVAAQHPDGALVIAPGSPTVYLIENGKKRIVGSPTVLLSQRITANMIKPATSADLTLQQAQNLGYREGTLIKGSAATVYIADDIDVGGGNIISHKKQISSIGAFIELNYGAADIMTIPDSDLATLPVTDPVN